MLPSQNSMSGSDKIGPPISVVAYGDMSLKKRPKVHGSSCKGKSKRFLITPTASGIHGSLSSYDRQQLVLQPIEESNAFKVLIGTVTANARSYPGVTEEPKSSERSNLSSTTAMSTASTGGDQEKSTKNSDLNKKGRNFCDQLVAMRCSVERASCSNNAVSIRSPVSLHFKRTTTGVGEEIQRTPTRPTITTAIIRQSSKAEILQATVPTTIDCITKAPSTSTDFELSSWDKMFLLHVSGSHGLASSSSAIQPALADARMQQRNYCYNFRKYQARSEATHVKFGAWMDEQRALLAQLETIRPTYETNFQVLQARTRLNLLALCGIQL
jgi:hypothetical protein